MTESKWINIKTTKY